MASYAAGLGASVQLFSVTGDDSEQIYALKSLASVGVNACLKIDESRPTTLEQRYRSKGKSLLRVSHLHQGAISTVLQRELLQEIKRALVSADLQVFSDFNYDYLSQTLVKEIATIAKRSGVMMVLDPVTQYRRYI